VELLIGVGGQGLSVSLVELAQEGGDVAFHRAFGDEQALGDVGIAQVVSDELQDLGLAP
jgi:hypothetical protein